jgi:hypothetical protein
MRCPSNVVDGLRGKRKWPLLMALFSLSSSSSSSHSLTFLPEGVDLGLWRKKIVNFFGPKSFNRPNVISLKFCRRRSAVDINVFSRRINHIDNEIYSLKLLTWMLRDCSWLHKNSFQSCWQLYQEPLNRGSRLSKNFTINDHSASWARSNLLCLNFDDWRVGQIEH